MTRRKPHADANHPRNKSNAHWASFFFCWQRQPTQRNRLPLAKARCLVPPGNSRSHTPWWPPSIGFLRPLIEDGTMLLHGRQLVSEACCDRIPSSLPSVILCWQQTQVALLRQVDGSLSRGFALLFIPTETGDEDTGTTPRHGEAGQEASTATNQICFIGRGAPFFRFQFFGVRDDLNAIQ